MLSRAFLFMSKINFIQLNIYKGKYLDEAVDFLKNESPDVIALQEVTKGGSNFYKDKKADLFEILKSKLGMRGVYDCVLKFRQYPEACFGNAVLTRFPILSSKVVVLRDSGPVDYSGKEEGDLVKDRPFVSRHLIDVLVDIDGNKVHAISVHGAWTAPPVDTEETLRQAQIIVDHIKSLEEEPFIMGGDLNAITGSRVIDMISAVSNNLMVGSGIAQTTHPEVHKISPRGFLVDYVFASNHFKKISVSSPVVTISDHLPVVARLEFGK